MATSRRDNIKEHPHPTTNNRTSKNIDNSKFSEKMFVPRDSYLRELYKYDVIKSWYYVFGAQLFAILLGVFVDEFTAYQNELTALRVLKNGFQQFFLAVQVWVVLFVVTVLTFYAFQAWATLRMHIASKKFLLKWWDLFWIALVFCYYCLTMFATAYVVVEIDFPFIISFTLMVEVVRLLMKTHSFIRTSAPEILSYKPHSDMLAPKKKLSNFLLFLFYPTLLYRDEYPRSSHIRWSFVANCVIELILIAVILAYLMKSLILQPLAEFGFKTYNWRDVVMIHFKFNMAGPLMTFVTFRFVLDTWQNLFAELTMFADRLFYKDWWSSTDHLRYYKTWNLIVHEWLYEYVYKDLNAHVVPRNKVLARILVILISAVFHEVIIGVSLRMFYPVLFLLFFFLGSLFTFLRAGDHYVWHILFITSICFGNLLQIYLYSLEYNARHNNPLVDTISANSSSIIFSRTLHVMWKNI